MIQIRSFMIRFLSLPRASHNPITVKFKNREYKCSLKSLDSSISTSRSFHSFPINFSQAKLYLPTMSVTNKQLLPHKSTNKQFTVCIEGNIGSGKTTLLHHLSRCSDVEVFQEPVDKWRNVRGMNMLDLMYQDPSRWAHLFQAYVQLTMLQLHTTKTKARVKIMERSIHSARHCFVENLHRTGKLSEPEYNVYCEWYKTISANLNINVDLIVFLSAEPSVVQQRIKERGRKEESSIPLQYLEELDTLHRQWLDTDNLPAPLLVLPQDMSTAEMCEAVESHIAMICDGKEFPPQSSPSTESKNLKSAPSTESKNLKSAPLTESKKLKSAPLTESKKLKSAPLTESKKLKSAPLTESKKLKSAPLTESKKLKSAPLTESKKLKSAPLTESKKLSSPLIESNKLKASSQ